MLYKSRLYGVQIPRLADALDGGDLVALVHHGKAEAAIHPPPIHVDCACAALAVVAAFLGAG
jgi:hypothetical protein